MAASNYDKLIETLKEVFMLDKAELDFGIYRIMNQKRKDIEQFLEKDLVPQVKQILAENLSFDRQALQKELEESITSARTLGADPDTLPKVQQIKARLGEAADLVGLENEVFSLLANFFRRYYDNGDFVSMRRYKKDVYAIPYEGEEVKLHWANSDQYYIKTAEHFKNYRFKLGNGKTVAFELTEASTEQNNNKTQNGKERRFSIHKEKPVEIIGEELKVYFTYESTDKKTKQDDLLEETFELVKQQIIGDFLLALELRPTEKDKTRTLLQKHLRDYVARNTFDYFIHKDLYGFLTRELDFYIKNEVLFIDDINTRDEKEFLKSLSKIKTIKRIGEKIVTFLSQLENFQKKLWLKKKFVVETNYCITLDRIPEEFFAEIVENTLQVDEWIRLFRIDKSVNSKNNELFSANSVGFSQPLKVDFLKQNPGLTVDTSFFDEGFKVKLISMISNFDDQLSGLLINSENFQAINLLRKRYNANIHCVYLDPPYNTDASAIMYKNDYKDSSWLSLMENRLILAKELLRNDGLIALAIDDEEVSSLRALAKAIFYKEVGVAVVRSNPQSRKTSGKFSPVHEYGLFYGKSENSIPSSIGYNQDKANRYPKTDEKGRYAWMNFIRAGSNDLRSDRPKLFYPIAVNSDNKIRVPELKWNEARKEYEILDKIEKDEVLVYPIKDENGKKIEKNWQRGHVRVMQELDEYRIRRTDEGISIDFKTRMDEEALPVTWWDKGEYASANYGATELKDLFGEKKFDFPKAIRLVEDSLLACGLTHKNTTALDFFGGSGTTAHAVININRKDQGDRKFIIVEMGGHCEGVIKPRIQKAVYSSEWKEGSPVKKDFISHCSKVIRLESYEDSLNNLGFKQDSSQLSALQANPVFKEGYMVNYMLDVETEDSLLNLEWFKDPFNCYLNITRNNEMKPTKVDMVETFNYLIGLVVESYAAPKKGFVVVTGKTLAVEKILVVWRDCNQHDNKSLNEFLQKSKYNPLDTEFDRIYVNGDNNVENLKVGEEKWKVALIEEEFKKRMFEEI